MTDGIFPRKKNDVEKPRLPSDVISRDIQDEPKPIETVYVNKVPVNHDVRPEVLKDIEKEPIVSQEFPVVQKPTVVATEKIADDVGEKIDLIEEEKLIQEPIIVKEETVIPREKIDHDEKKIDFVKEKELVQEPVSISEEIVTPTEKIVDRDEKKINFVEEKELVQEPVIVREEAVTPTAKVADRDDEKIDLIIEEKLDQEPVTVEKETDIPTERIAERDDEKIDFVEEKEMIEGIAAEPEQEVPIAIEEPEIIEDEIKLAPITKIELEPSRELEEHCN